MTINRKRYQFVRKSPEYFDGKNSSLIGKEARKFQVWTIAGYIVAYTLLEYPEKVSLFFWQRARISGMSFIGVIKKNI